ncbi:integrase [Leptolinea sp. HRD-7]|nr:integrase [Leptolinea sp. HRD-7]
MEKLTLSQALNGYDLHAQARHLSQHTLDDYRNTFRRFKAWWGNSDPYFDEILREQIEDFLSSLNLKKKTVLNYHTGLSALWEWAVEVARIAPTNLLHRIERPKPEKPDIIPYTEQEIRLMLSSADRSKAYMANGTMASHNIANSIRNRAIILLLTDTGLRASELCDLKIRDADLRANIKRVRVIEGKGDKSRHIPISARTAQAVWKYLLTRPDSRLDDPLFVTRTNSPMDRRNLFDVIEYAGDRAGVPNAHPHRFRHTFAINFLRNGGNVYALQDILGHESLKTCMKYLKIAQTDIENAHRLASPVDNWQL